MKKVLVIGSGKVANSIVDFFSKLNHKVTVASNNLEEAQTLVKTYGKNCEAVYLDITNEENSKQIIGKADIVLSMVIPSLHKYVLDYCIKMKKDMICSSYLQPGYNDLDQQAKDAGISVLFEVGLDPGIDHIVTMKMIEEVRNKNGRIKSLYSHCGGLVSPKYIDNPLSYKFTWSPEGAIKAISDSVYLENGELKQIKKEDLLNSTKPLFINNSLNLVYYPNRDSTKYKNLYQIKEVQTLIRGTIRFKGYCEIISSFLDIGLLDQDKKVEKPMRVVDMISEAIKNQPEKLKVISEEVLNQTLQSLPNFHPEVNINKLVNKITEKSFWKELTPNQQFDRLRIVLDGYNYFKFLNSQTTLQPNETILGSVVALMKGPLEMKPDDEDFVVMIIEILAQYPNGQQEQLKFQLLENGEVNKYTGMSKTVGLTTSVAAYLVLEGKINKTGVFGPFIPEVYNPLYEGLLKNNLIKKYVTQPLIDMPKL